MSSITLSKRKLSIRNEFKKGKGTLLVPIHAYERILLQELNTIKKVDPTDMHTKYKFTPSQTIKAINKLTYLNIITTKTKNGFMTMSLTIEGKVWVSKNKSALFNVSNNKKEIQNYTFLDPEPNF